MGTGTRSIMAILAGYPSPLRLPLRRTEHRKRDQKIAPR